MNTCIRWYRQGSGIEDVAKFIIRVDDVCPTMGWDRFNELSETLLDAGAPCLIGVIPDCRDPALHRSPAKSDFWDVIRGLKASGWTIAQHGYTHVYDCLSLDRLGLMRKSEFAGHNLETQASRLASGASLLADEGVASDVFMAPSHAFDDTTMLALRQTGFRFVTDGAALWPYEEQGLTFVPQLFSYPRHFGIGVYTICYHLDTVDEFNFQELLRFVRSNAHRILSFDEAARFPRNDLIANASRRVLEYFEYSHRSAQIRRAKDVARATCSRC